ncbi:hypothetical protein I7I50_01995 [Histoplasma capsulatum G186AR]|uniref:Uncharacterized protein n=1 Tax=Ajellomyces capsulatus TaxID=5037 RepID=A0A8H7YFW0_AJECA|nr:hypothetical protein I7I52_12209 [Histoplasma capsulatum]QSS71233.1 hypothetical protein I7I50_01995 [Histoplasma capsulatum G186AR]
MQRHLVQWRTQPGRREVSKNPALPGGGPMHSCAINSSENPRIPGPGEDSTGDEMYFPVRHLCSADKSFDPSSIGLGTTI